MIDLKEHGGAYGGGNGLKYAEGTITNAAATSSFIMADGTQYNEMPFVQVTGLSFKPRTIILRSTSGSYGYTTYYPENIFSSSGNAGRIISGAYPSGGIQSYNTFTYREDGVYAFVNNTGFRLPVQYLNTNWKWYAFE